MKTEETLRVSKNPQGLSSIEDEASAAKDGGFCFQQYNRNPLTAVASLRGVCYNFPRKQSIRLMEMDDESFMQEALSEARRAGEKGEVPVGAVAVLEGRIIARGHNRKEELKDPTAHAEMIALREAARVLAGWRLVGVTLYCTMEPCPMCAGAMVQARLPRLVYAVDDPKAGAAGSVLDLVRDERLNHRVKVVRGVLATEVEALLAGFFETLREGAGVDDRGGLENRCGGDSTVGSNPTPPA